MKLSQLVLLAVALGAGVAPAISQAQESPPPKTSDAAPEAGLLGANYRIVIIATANGKKAGEISILTCSSAIQTDGMLSVPTEDNRFGTGLAVQGWLAELEGGALKLSYTLRMMTPVPTQMISSVSEARTMATTIEFKKMGATGMLLAKPGQSYEILKITDVVYSISITPTDTWTVERQQQEAKPPAPADQNKPSAATTTEGKSQASSRGRPSAEEMERLERFKKLSDEAKDKLRSAMSEARDKLMNATPEERAAFVKKVFDQIAAEDQAKKPKSS